MVIDIILCVILLGAFLIGTKRGLLRTIWGLAAMIATVIATTILYPDAVAEFADFHPAAVVTVLFIAIRILLAVIYNILDLIFKFPILKQTNKLAGGILQTAVALIAIYAILAVATAYETDIIHDSYICKSMYENNILVSLLERT